MLLQYSINELDYFISSGWSGACVWILSYRVEMRLLILFAYYSHVLNKLLWANEFTINDFDSTKLI